jgi:Domain of unknown function (DUF4105)
MKKLILIIIVSLLSFQSAKPFIQLSDSATISLLTCTPGTEVYSIFGHSAIRVSDPVRNLDKIYNYGTFDFATPNFYTKFVTGRLDYVLSTTKFKYFVYDYKVENRGVFEQYLNINKSQKQALFNNLEINASPKNRMYRYDFFFDNCATRIRDIFEKSLGDSLVYNTDSYTQELNFRDLLHPYISYSQWLDLGINLALGLPADKIAVPSEYTFLPDHLMDYTSKAYYSHFSDSTKLLSHAQQIVSYQKFEIPRKYLTPTNIFILILILFIALTYMDFEKKRITFWPDIILFSIVGILGTIITFLWLGTDHLAMNHNLNFIWAMPLNLIIVFFLSTKKHEPIVFYYQVVYSIILFTVLISWSWFPQRFSIYLIPIIFILFMRSAYYVYHLLNLKKNAELLDNN